MTSTANPAPHPTKTILMTWKLTKKIYKTMHRTFLIPHYEQFSNLSAVAIAKSIQEFVEFDFQRDSIFPTHAK